MSRIGRKPIQIPQGVTVKVDGTLVRADGPKGKLTQQLPPGLSAALEDNHLVIARASDARQQRALHGLARSLVANMVTGVKDGFEKRLEIQGIGYRAQLQGRVIQLALGFSHPVLFPLPEGITAEVERQTAITLRGPDKALLGQTAAKLRALRSPIRTRARASGIPGKAVRRRSARRRARNDHPGSARCPRQTTRSAAPARAGRSRTAPAGGVS